jgi:hypothetical protein
MDEWVVPLDSHCLICNNFMVRKFVLVWDPPILAVECGENKPTPDMLLEVNSITGRHTRHRYWLHGVIYFNAIAEHYTARFITRSNFI